MDDKVLDNAPQSEKRFTQEEVNEIVKNRLERYKKSHEKELSEAIQASKEAPDSPSYDERMAELEKREKALQLKESRSAMIEFLNNNNLPQNLLEIADLENVEASQEAILRYAEAFGYKPNMPSPLGQYDHDGGHVGNLDGFNGMTVAGSKHKPKDLRFDPWK